MAVLLVEKQETQIALARWRLANNLEKEASSHRRACVHVPAIPVLAGGLDQFYRFRSYKVRTLRSTSAFLPRELFYQLSICSNDLT